MVKYRGQSSSGYKCFYPLYFMTLYKLKCYTCQCIMIDYILKMNGYN